MLNEKQFDAWLQNRRFEPASEGFAERIIGRAVVRERRRSLPDRLWEWMGGRMLPRPAYGLLAVLGLGLLIGAALPVRGAHTTYVAMDEEEML